jgi:uncharacterized protein involved in outer membrane biogenesis
MEASWDARRWLKLTLRTLALLVALLAVLAAAVLILSSHLRGPVIRYVETHSGRQVRVGGKLDVYLFSLHPRIVAEQVTIGNPPWTSSGTTAEIGHLALTFDLPRLAVTPIPRRSTDRSTRGLLSRGVATPYMSSPPRPTGG